MGLKQGILVAILTKYGIGCSGKMRNMISWITNMVSLSYWNNGVAYKDVFNGNTICSAVCP